MRDRALRCRFDAIAGLNGCRNCAAGGSVGRVFKLHLQLQGAVGGGVRVLGGVVKEVLRVGGVGRVGHCVYRGRSSWLYLGDMSCSDDEVEMQLKFGGGQRDADAALPGTSAVVNDPLSPRPPVEEKVVDVTTSSKNRWT